MIIQENRSFDSYFGTYPGADGIPASDGHFTVCLPDPLTGGCDRPFHDSSLVNGGGPHGEGSVYDDLDGGMMDGFVRESETAGGRGCGGFAGVCSSFAPSDVMGYHDAREIPNYWSYAENFVLDDHMFQSNASWSLPAHLYEVSEWSAKCSRPGDPSSCVNDDELGGYQTSDIIGVGARGHGAAERVRRLLRTARRRLGAVPVRSQPRSARNQRHERHQRDERNRRDWRSRHRRHHHDRDRRRHRTDRIESTLPAGGGEVPAARQGRAGQVAAPRSRGRSRPPTTTPGPTSRTCSTSTGSAGATSSLPEASPIARAGTRTARTRRSASVPRTSGTRCRRSPTSSRTANWATSRTPGGSSRTPPPELCRRSPGSSPISRSPTIPRPTSPPARHTSPT